MQITTSEIYGPHLAVQHLAILARIDDGWVMKGQLLGPKKDVIYTFHPKHQRVILISNLVLVRTKTSSAPN